MKNSEEKRRALEALLAETVQISEKHDSYQRLLAREIADYLTSFEKHTQIAETAEERFDRFFAEFPVSDMHLYAWEVATKLEEKGILPIGEPFGAFPKRPSVCYPQNRFVQQAADRLRLDAEWFYAEDYGEGCAAVAEGKKDGCLLPFLSPDGKEMTGMLRLIEEAGLKKHTVIYLNTREQRAGYLLATALLPLPENREEPWWAEVLLAPHDHTETEEILKLCALSGAFYELLSPTAVYDFENGSEEIRNLSATLRLKAPANTLLRLLFALRLLSRDSTVTGFYTVLYQNDD